MMSDLFLLVANDGYGKLELSGLLLLLVEMIEKV